MIKDLKIIIKIMKGKNHKVEIVPLLWLLFPDVRTFANEAKKDLVTIWEKGKTYQRMVPRYYGRTYVVHWLCFQIYIGGWELSDAGRVYPTRWNSEQKSEIENLAKYEDLCKTGYYS